jgi:hypothetical protein
MTWREVAGVQLFVTIGIVALKLPHAPVFLCLTTTALNVKDTFQSRNF